MIQPSDLIGMRRALLDGTTTAAEQMALCLEASRLPKSDAVFIRTFDAQAQTVARAHDEMAAAGAPRPPLAGLAVSIKDLFDVFGAPTTAGSAAMRDRPVAGQDALAVARLRAAGAAFIGHTNLSEFAYSGVGINPHHGTPANAATLEYDATVRIPGGSTSGGACSVAAGSAWAALGSDTGGSIRIPAALQGLVGFKNTQRLTPRQGCVPLSTTLDTACAVTLSVRDAVLLHEVLAGRSVRLRKRPIGACRFAVPTAVMLDNLDAEVATAFEQALRELRRRGATLLEVDWPDLGEPAGMQANGGFAAAESWAAHHRLLLAQPALFDPRVAARIRRGQAISAGELIELREHRARWIEHMDARMAPFDAVLSPTVPIVAPALQPLLDNDDLFFATNGRLLRNPSIVNFLDGCAISMPCHAPGSLPVGLMVWSGASSDDSLLDVALGIEAALAPRRS